MSAEERPQLYLSTPSVIDLEAFPPVLARILDSFEIACVRLALSGRDEFILGRVADALRQIAHERDVAIVIDTHVALAARHGLDGVHLMDSARSVRTARKELGADAIVGAYCGNSRDAGMNAGEAGADYVTFGPVSDPLGSAKLADREIFSWWSEMVEVPVVAEGGLTPALIASLAPVTDFFSIGDEIWNSDDPAETLRNLLAPLA